jgi:hypothetical protein
MIDSKTYALDMLWKHYESYVVKLNPPPCTNVYKRSAIERTHILQEEDDKSLSIWMSMHPKEREIENEEQEVQEKEDMVQLKLGDVLEPLKDDSNSQTPNHLFMHESNYESMEIEGNCYYYYDSNVECIDMPAEIIVDNDFKDDEDYQQALKPA